MKQILTPGACNGGPDSNLSISDVHTAMLLGQTRNLWKLIPVRPDCIKMVLGGEIIKKKTPNFWKKLEVSTVKYMSTWCSMTYPLCQMLLSSLRLHTADRPMWRLESSSQQFASACIWGTAGSSCAHGMVPPLPTRRCLWAAVTLFEGHTEMEHQSENLDFQKQSCGLIYCLLGSAFF